MNNIEKIYEMLDWNNSESIQNNAIELSKTIQDLDLFFQPIDLKNNVGKNIWENCAKIICNRSEEELEKYIYKMLEWLEDLNWPGALIIFDKLKKYSYQKLEPILHRTILDAIKDNRIAWLENINELVQENRLKEKNQEYIINYNIEQVNNDLKNIPELINNLLNNQSIYESIIFLSSFHDPVFMLYFNKYINSKEEDIVFSITKYFNTINKLMQGKNFSEKSNKDFYSYLFNTINYNYDIIDIKNDLENKNLRVSALRMLNLFCNKSLSPYFEMYKDDKDYEVRKAVVLGMNNIKYYGF